MFGIFGSKATVDCSQLISRETKMRNNNSRGEKRGSEEELFERFGRLMQEPFEASEGDRA